jgi:hypothetical protein
VILLIAGVGFLLLLGGVGVAVWLLGSRAVQIAGGDGPGGEGDQGNGPAGGEAPQVQIISPLARFKTDFPQKGVGNHLEIQSLFVSEDGSLVAATNNHETQVWAVSAEPKNLYAIPHRAQGVSNDRRILYVPGDSKSPVVGFATGHWSEESFVGFSSFDSRYTGHNYLPGARFTWTRSGDSSKAAPFNIYQSELPSQRRVDATIASDDDRVALCAPIKQGKELVFGVPAQNTVRVWDFEKKAVVRQFQLANLKEFRGPPPL